MTVEELIAELEKSSPNVQVLVACEVEGTNSHPVRSVSMPLGARSVRLVVASGEDIWPEGFLGGDSDA